MESAKTKLQGREWRKDHYLISTDSSLVPVAKLIDIFNSEGFYWSKALPAPAMQEMLDNSLCFGLYEQAEPIGPSNATPELKFLGIARLVTDYITFAYLTDVWVEPSCQGNGLGSWMVRCIDEVLETMPHLRRCLLFTGDWQRSVPFYDKLLRARLIETRKGEGLAIMERKGRGHPTFNKEGTGYN